MLWDGVKNSLKEGERVSFVRNGRTHRGTVTSGHYQADAHDFTRITKFDYITEILLDDPYPYLSRVSIINEPDEYFTRL
jgi:hypothetical protein